MTDVTNNWVTRAMGRAQTGADLVLHGAVDDFRREAVKFDETAAAKVIGASMIEEILDHGLKIDIDFYRVTKRIRLEEDDGT